MRRSLLLTAFLAGACASVDEPKIAPDWTAADAAKPLSHADCVRLAAQSAPTAAAWRARLLTAQAALRQAATRANPSASVGWENVFLEATPVQTTLTLSYALASLVQRPQQEAAARFDLDATRADLLAERGKLAADVCRAYDDLVASRRRVEIAADAVAVAGRQRDAVEKFVAAGAKAQFEVDRAAAEAAKARADEASAKSEARAKELALAFAVGFARPVTLQLKDGLASDPVVESEESLFEAAKERPEIAAATARYAAQLERAHLATSWSQFAPTLTAGPRKEGSDNSAVFSLDVDLPVFDTGGAAADAASAALLAAAADLRKTVREVGQDVAAAHERLAAAESFLVEHARPLAAARAALREKADRLFEAGEIEFDETVAARRDEIEARGALLDAELAVAQARTDLGAATARIAETTVPLAGRRQDE